MIKGNRRLWSALEERVVLYAKADVTEAARADFVPYRGHVQAGAFDADRVVPVGNGGVCSPDRRSV